jgi:hypothetical protein
MVGLKGFEPLPLRLRAGYACPLTPQTHETGATPRDRTELSGVSSQRLNHVGLGSITNGVISGGRTHTPGFTDQCAEPLHYDHHKWRRVKESNLHRRSGDRFSKPALAPRQLYPPNLPARTLGMRGSGEKPTVSGVGVYERREPYAIALVGSSELHQLFSCQRPRPAKSQRGLQRQRFSSGAGGNRTHIFRVQTGCFTTSTAAPYVLA